MKRIVTLIENIFENFLFSSRFLVMIAVLGALLASAIMFIDGGMKVLKAGSHLIESVQDFGKELSAEDLEAQSRGLYTDKENKIVVLLIKSVDSFLIAIVLLIFSMGSYELFISAIDPASKSELSRRKWLHIDNIDDLKNSIAKVVIMILIIELFRISIYMNYEKAIDLMFLGIAIMFVAVALFFANVKFSKLFKKKDSTEVLPKKSK